MFKKHVNLIHQAVHLSPVQFQRLSDNMEALEPLIPHPENDKAPSHTWPKLLELIIKLAALDSRQADRLHLHLVDSDDWLFAPKPENVPITFGCDRITMMVHR